MKFNIFILSLICLLNFSCKEATPSKTTTDTPPSTPSEEAIPKIESEPIPVTQNSEEPDLTQTSPLTTYAQQFFTKFYWHYEAAVVVKAPEKGKAYIGKWIKLNEDNSLETGFYDGAVTTGKWILDEGKNIITLVENDVTPAYSEWTIKTSSSSDDIMIWVGTKRFHQNNTQIKMIRYHEKPAKKEVN